MREHLIGNKKPAYNKLNKPSSRAAQRKLYPPQPNTFSPIQRMIYVGKDSMHPIETLKEMPAQFHSLFDKSDEEAEHILFELEQALTDLEYPIRIDEESSMDDLRFQTTHKSGPAFWPIKRNMGLVNIFIGMPRDKADTLPFIEQYAHQRIPFDLSEILDEITDPQGNIIIDEENQEHEICELAKFLFETKKFYPDDGSQACKSRWEAMKLNITLYFFTKVSRNLAATHLHILMDHLDEATVVSSGASLENGVSGGFAPNVLNIVHHAYMSHKGVRSPEVETMSLSGMHFYQHGVEITWPWEQHQELWRQKENFAFDPNRCQSPSLARQNADLFCPRPLWRRNNAQAQGWTDKSDLLVLRNFQKSLKEEDPFNFHQRNMLVPLLPQMEELVDEYESLKEDMAKTRAEMVQVNTYWNRLKGDERISRLRVMDIKGSRFQLLTLHKLEELIYEWNRTTEFISFRYHPIYSSSILALLKCVTQEHLDLIRYTNRANISFVNLDNSMRADEEREFNDYCQHFRIQDKDHSVLVFKDHSFKRQIPEFDKEEFIVNILDMFAKIMSKPEGRKYFRPLAAFKAYMMPTKEENMQLSGQFPTNTRVADCKYKFSVENPFPRVIAGRAAESNFLIPVNGKKIELYDNMKSMPYFDPEVRTEQRAKESKFDTTLKDLEHRTLPNKRLILMPDFVAFYHEMGHAWNNLKGANRKALFEEEYKADPNALLMTNNEEHYVIEFFENQIRKAWHLPLRMNHVANTASIDETLKLKVE
ncbi:hypothetical protein [Aureibacter tunicatorum]|uniref:Uncharacterized protein n=1 Tax=Aureibacter tunicatorum TaxID=866807 RepID=A0AAE4BUA0_9BACT|nr:hypothetical protein [Aureibacter tunicatorum]MDR6240835.1 hypothetical protein [Aureibacter tunicatorum]BDD06832.1 hypothetical protein AUTU_43150 [Aureibacter tunicatorum]